MNWSSSDRSRRLLALSSIVFAVCLSVQLSPFVGVSRAEPIGSGSHWLGVSTGPAPATSSVASTRLVANWTYDSWNNTRLPGIFSPPNPGYGWSAVVDPANDRLYITTSEYAVATFNATSGAPLRMDPVPVSGSRGGALDAQSSVLYLTGYSEGKVVAFNVTTDRVVATIPVGTHPSGVAWDPLSNDVFVANNGSANVTVISGASNSVVANLPVGTNPTGVTDAPNLGHVFVANWGSDNVTVIDGRTRAILASPSVGSEPVSIAYNPVPKTVYVANDGSGNLTVLSGTTNHVSGWVPLANTSGSASSAAFDPANDKVYVADPLLGNTGAQLWVVSTSPSIVVHHVLAPYIGRGIAYSPFSHDLCLVLTIGGASVYSPAKGTIVGTLSLYTQFPWDVAYDPVSAELFVAGLVSYLGVAVLDPRTGHLITDIQLSHPVESLAYDSRNNTIAALNQLNALVYVINGSTNKVVTSFTATFYPDPESVSYDPFTNEFLIASYLDYSVVSWNASTYQMLQYVSVNNAPEYVLGGTPNALVYSADYGMNSIELVNLTSGTVVSTISLPGGSTSVNRLVLDRVTNEIYVIGSGTNNVSVLDPTTNRVTANISIGSNPGSAAYNPNSGDVYVAAQGGVSVVSARGKVAVQSVPVGNTRSSVAFDPTTHEVYVTNGYNGSVTALKIVTGGPSIASFHAQPSSVAHGTSMHFVTNVTHPGVGLTYVYTGLPPGCASANAATLACTPSTAGHYPVWVTIYAPSGAHVSQLAVLTVTEPTRGRRAGDA